MSSPETFVDKEVYCKRNGTTGLVTAQDGLTVTILTDGTEKTVSLSTFSRWYSVVEKSDKVEPTSGEPDTPAKTDKNTTAPTGDESTPPPKQDEEKASEKAKKVILSGEPGIGEQLCEKFLSLVKEQADQDLDVTYDDKTHRHIVKYNGKNVFECSTASKRFNVLCHPKSLTPVNFKKVTEMCPKEWGWSLCAKFVFTAITEWPLMKTIIADGLYYRQIKN